MDALAFLDGAIPPAVPPPVSYHRPNGYSEDLARRICDQIADGKVLRCICDGKNGMPASRVTVYRWLADQPDFRSLFNWALRWRTEAFAEDIIEIGDDGSQDWKLDTDDDGAQFQVLNKEALARSHMRVENRKWLLAKLLPRQYGTKSEDLPAIPTNGDDAKPLKAIEADPLYPQVLAWLKDDRPKAKP